MIKTVPIEHSLCGGLTYTSTFDGAAISVNWPVKYDASTRTHNVYSEDEALKGVVKPYTVQASLTDYPTTVSEVKTANIQFKDPCPAPEDLTATSQTNPVDYYYTA